MQMYRENANVAVLIACRLLGWQEEDYNRKVYAAGNVKGNFEIYWISEPSEIEVLCFNAGWAAVEGGLVGHSVGSPQRINFNTVNRKYTLGTLLEGWRVKSGRPPKFGYRELGVHESLAISVVELQALGSSVATIRTSISTHARREGKQFKTRLDAGVLYIKRYQ